MFRTNFPTIVFYLRKTSFQCYEALCIPNASRVINNRGMRQTPRKGGKTIVPRSCRASEKHAFSKKCARKSIVAERVINTGRGIIFPARCTEKGA